MRERYKLTSLLCLLEMVSSRNFNDRSTDFLILFSLHPAEEAESHRHSNTLGRNDSTSLRWSHTVTLFRPNFVQTDTHFCSLKPSLGGEWGSCTDRYSRQLYEVECVCAWGVSVNNEGTSKEKLLTVLLRNLWMPSLYSNRTSDPGVSYLHI